MVRSGQHPLFLFSCCCTWAALRYHCSSYSMHSPAPKDCPKLLWGAIEGGEGEASPQASPFLLTLQPRRDFPSPYACWSCDRWWAAQPCQTGRTMQREASWVRRHHLERQGCWPPQHSPPFVIYARVNANSSALFFFLFFSSRSCGSRATHSAQKLSRRIRQRLKKWRSKKKKRRRERDEYFCCCC